MKGLRKTLLVSLSILLILGIALTSIVYASSPQYLLEEGDTFMGRTNFALYEHDATKLASTENIRYMAVYILNIADDDVSLLLGGNWTANTTTMNGALVMFWNSTYGPWADKAAYIAHNVSVCNVTPDYFFICWGLQGNYSSGLFSNTKPYLTLTGVGLGVDWVGQNITAFGSVDLRGRLYSSRNATLTKYKTGVTLQLLETAGVPHWNGSKPNISLTYEADGETCMTCLLGDAYWLCEWIYNHFGVWLCQEGPR